MHTVRVAGTFPQVRVRADGLREDIPARIAPEQRTWPHKAAGRQKLSEEDFQGNPVP
jgi:hypothetical protein